MAVIAVNFVVPLSVMFYCYYNVSVTVKRYKASNCLDGVNTDWSDQMDVTKVNLHRPIRVPPTPLVHFRPYCGLTSQNIGPPPDRT